MAEEIGAVRTAAGGAFYYLLDCAMLHFGRYFKLGGKICGALPIAHKTGEDDNLSNDVGIIFAPQPFILCFAAHGTSVYP